MSEDKRDHLISVLIADDEPGMRLILRKKIQATDGFFVAGEAVTGDEAMTLYDKLNPQVVFLDGHRMRPADSGSEPRLRADIRYRT